ncbi:hypothetical protein EV421DRAFT_1220135 [Armillaria borealis]|uniref:Uncharacterized protein n=1 Tax=Armillaria borealis TaxID=47425 RepID=A0AA39J3T4_9AGAR|nr:hypothetical protein EV421DRAFT_1220135 [Armillaria borealis]
MDSVLAAVVTKKKPGNSPLNGPATNPRAHFHQDLVPPLTKLFLNPMLADPAGSPTDTSSSFLTRSDSVVLVVSSRLSSQICGCSDSKTKTMLCTPLPRSSLFLLVFPVHRAPPFLFSPALLSLFFPVPFPFPAFACSCVPVHRGSCVRAPVVFLCFVVPVFALRLCSCSGVLILRPCIVLAFPSRSFSWARAPRPIP